MNNWIDFNNRYNPISYIEERWRHMSPSGSHYQVNLNIEQIEIVKRFYDSGQYVNGDLYRQIGKTSIAAAIAYHQLKFGLSDKILYFTINDNTAKQVGKLIEKNCYLNDDSFVSINNTNISINDRSVSIFSNSDVLSYRGIYGDLIIMDEFKFFIDDFFQYSIPFLLENKPKLLAFSS